MRAPSKTQLRAEVALLSVIEIGADFNPGARESSGSRSKNRSAEVSVLLRDWSEILPPQTEGESQVWPEFVIVLSKQCIQVGARVFAEIGGNTGDRIERSLLG